MKQNSHTSWSSPPPFGPITGNRNLRRLVLPIAIILMIVYSGRDWLSDSERKCCGPCVGQESLNVSARTISTAPVASQIDPLDEKLSSIVPQIAKVTVSYGDAVPIYDRIIDGHRLHAEKHGYKFFILRERLLHRLYSKPAYLLSLVMQELAKPSRERVKWLFFFDRDVVLLNEKIPLEIFLPPEPEFKHINLLITNDHNGLNSGAFFIRVAEWSINFLADTVSMPNFLPDLELKYSEQSAMELLAVSDDYESNTIFVPQRWFNGYRGPRDESGELIPKPKVNPNNTAMPGDIVMHFAGKASNKAHMETFVIKAEAHDPRWEVELEKTTYPKEIALFWDRTRAQMKAKENGKYFGRIGGVGRPS